MIALHTAIANTRNASQAGDQRTSRAARPCASTRNRHNLAQMDNPPNTRLPTSLFFLLAVTGVVRMVAFATQLPSIAAVHFVKGGLPNGWQSKSALLYSQLVMILFSTVIAFGVPRLIAILPPALINLPNKDYWLSGDRRSCTLAWIRGQFAWFGCALLSFLLLVNELILRANLTESRHLDTQAFVTVLFVFLGFVLLWTFRLIRHFAVIRR